MRTYTARLVTGISVSIETSLTGNLRSGIGGTLPQACSRLPLLVARGTVATGFFDFHDLPHLDVMEMTKTQAVRSGRHLRRQAADTRARIREVIMTIRWFAAQQPRRSIAKCLLAVLGSLPVLIPGAVLGQDQKMIRIGVIKIVSHTALDADEKGFETALASAGFREGVNVTYDRQNAQGDAAKAAAIARKFEADKVDLVHTIATPSSQAVVKVISRIPVVFSAMSDPVDAGVVPNDSTPGKKTGSNVTGVSDMWPIRLQMETYTKFVPKAKKWGTIYNPTEANSVANVRAIRAAATSLGLELTEATVTGGNEVERAALSLVGKVQAITITSDNTTVANIDVIARVCNQHKIALFAGDVDSVPRGAIAAYGMDYFLVGYSAGKKAALVLKGVKPGEIPWGPVEKFSLVINQKAARDQGVSVSADLLKKADKVLE